MRSATLPATRWRMPVRPCVPITTRSACCASIARLISSTGEPITTTPVAVTPSLASRSAMSCRCASALDCAYCLTLIGAPVSSGTITASGPSWYGRSITWSSTIVPPCARASSRAIAAAWLAEAEKSCGTRMVFQVMATAYTDILRRHLEHALDRPQRARADPRGPRPPPLEVAQREVELGQRVALHVRAQVARAALVVGRRRDQRLPRRGLLHLVQDAGLGRDDEGLPRARPGVLDEPAGRCDVPGVAQDAVVAHRID